jgi:hypothetical protein
VSAAVLVLLEPGGVEAAVDGPAALGAGRGGQVQFPAMGGVGFGPVGVDPVQHALDHGGQRLGMITDRAGEQRRVDAVVPVQVDTERSRGGQPGGGGDLRHDRGLIGGDPAGAGGLGPPRQLLQRPSGAYHPAGGRGGDVQVPRQPRLHRLVPVELRGLVALGGPDGLGQCGLDDVLQLDQPADPGQRMRCPGGR